MGDWRKIMTEVNAKLGVDEISDTCARMIASMWHEGDTRSFGYAFVATGAITDPTGLWRELFGPYDDGQPAAYVNATWQERLAMDMLGTYLVRKGERGPVSGWADLWL